MKNYLMGIALCMIYSSYGCSNNTPKAETVNENQAVVEKEIHGPVFDNDYVNNVFEQYLYLKFALFTDDTKEAELASKILAIAIKDASMETAKKSAAEMLAAKGVKAKRLKLNALSNELAILFKKEKLVAGGFYIQFCPMANDGEGAYWLSAERKIQNPYYGSEMPTCGSVKEVVK